MGDKGSSRERSKKKIKKKPQLTLKEKRKRKREKKQGKLTGQQFYPDAGKQVTGSASCSAGGGQTHMMLPPEDFKSSASAYSAGTVFGYNFRVPEVRIP